MWRWTFHWEIVETLDLIFSKSNLIQKYVYDGLSLLMLLGDKQQYFWEVIAALWSKERTPVSLLFHDKIMFYATLW